MPANPPTIHVCVVKCVASIVSQISLVDIEKVPTTPIEGQKTGTSGLRKKVAVFKQPHYLEVRANPLI